MWCSAPSRWRPPGRARCWQLGILRFFAGVGIGGLLPNVIALNAEFAPRRLQATAVIVSFAGITIGGSLPGLIAAYLMPHYGWPILFYFGGLVPLLLAGVIATWLPESIRFLALKDRQAEVAAMVQRMDPGTVLPAGTRFIVQVSEKLPFRYLFGGKLAVMTPLLWTLFVLNLMAYFFLVSWMPTLLSSASIPVSQAALATTMLQVGGFLGSLAIALPLDRRGMLPIVALFVLSVPVIGSIGYVALQSPLYMMLIVTLAGFCTLGAQSGLNAITAILYPTAVALDRRGRGLRHRPRRCDPGSGDRGPVDRHASAGAAALHDRRHSVRAGRDRGLHPDADVCGADADPRSGEVSAVASCERAISRRTLRGTQASLSDDG